MVSWACDPFAAVAGLPATELEAGEPERLYTLLTRDQGIEPLDYAPDDLVPLILRCLAKDPAERPRPGAEQLLDLAQYLGPADVAEVDAPLGVVLRGRHVVVAAVDVEDLLGRVGRGHGAHGV